MRIISTSPRIDEWAGIAIRQLHEGVRTNASNLMQTICGKPGFNLLDLSGGMLMGGPAAAPASGSGSGDGRQFDGIVYLRMSKVTLGSGLLLLSALLLLATPTPPLQCGFILLTAIFCWHCCTEWSRSITAISIAVLVFSAWLHASAWDSYLLACMAFIAAEG